MAIVASSSSNASESLGVLSSKTFAFQDETSSTTSASEGLCCDEVGSEACTRSDQELFSGLNTDPGRVTPKPPYSAQVAMTLHIVRSTWVEPLSKSLHFGEFYEKNAAFMKAYSALSSCEDDSGTLRELRRGFWEIMEGYCRQEMAAVPVPEGEALLQCFVDFWKRYTEFIFEVHRVFKHLDDSCSGSRRSTLFKIAVGVFSYSMCGRYAHKIASTISAAADKERGGQVANASIVRSTVDIISVLGSPNPLLRRVKHSDSKQTQYCWENHSLHAYEKYLEIVLLRGAALYYKRESASWMKKSSQVDTLAAISKCIGTEEELADTYYRGTLLNKIMVVMRETLLHAIEKNGALISIDAINQLFPDFCLDSSHIDACKSIVLGKAPRSESRIDALSSAEFHAVGEFTRSDLWDAWQASSKQANNRKDVRDMIRSTVAVRESDGRISTVVKPPRPASAVYPLNTREAPGRFQGGKQLVEALPDAPRPLCPIVHVGCVTPCPDEELEPLLTWLRSATELPKHQLAFPRGTICPDGRLDLCKQALGPAHCRTIAEAIPTNGVVKHLLLGMDGLGDDGAAAIAELVASRDPLETVFLGCNAIRSSGIAQLADAVGVSQRVRNLWLKRNPIGVTGAEDLARALRLNSKLRTLDLTNTMLGNDGLAVLSSAITDHASLECVYLGANGITADGAKHLGKLLSTNNVLVRLFLDCNRLGDEGVSALLLGGGGCLTTLSLSSNAISDFGIAGFISSCTAPLRWLDLGRSPTALTLGEQHNTFGVRGATDLVSWLLSGEGNKTLTKLVLGSVNLPQDLQIALDELLRRNLAAFRSVNKSWRMPEDIAAIQSVYRVPASRAGPSAAPPIPPANSESSTPNSSILLNDGRSIPQLALGVYKTAPGTSTFAAVLCALRAGYRHIDTAELYKNEKDVGAAVTHFLAETGLPRESIWITTKFNPQPGRSHSPADALAASLQRLGMDYVDLYLIHKPNDKKRRTAHWQELVSLQRHGLARSIGVSNYGVRHLEELLSSSDVVPAINQVEISPFLQREDLVHFCFSHGIACAAHSPLTKAQKLSDSRLLKVAAAYNVTPAQILIRWSLQKGFVVIPKSTRPDRIVANGSVASFELSCDDMATLTSWDEGFLSFGFDATDRP
jgi:diketogulonate reductase-like aldo/keto reductase